MIIAITYENGNVFQHFGKTHEFKIYDVELKQILGSELVSTAGQGHSALVNFLDQRNVDVVICGGIGMPAINAFTQRNMKVVPGASGNVDEVVQQYIKGTLLTSEGICTHHDHGEGHDCSDHGCH
ncbi:MAG: NifB/NifX family molybdenum-iron cluster-binding protein [Firmicutes bacterium]|nr:NifB/NifX family molybdenum-iron cluster-binding protein [Bacillota bacterium]